MNCNDGRAEQRYCFKHMPNKGRSVVLDRSRCGDTGTCAVVERFSHEDQDAEAAAERRAAALNRAADAADNGESS